jgi:hypothetical protein
MDSARSRLPGQVAPAGVAWRQDELIYSVSADPALTTAQFIAIADNTTGGWRPGKSVAVEAPGRAPWPGWLGTGDK